MSLFLTIRLFMVEFKIIHDHSNLFSLIYSAVCVLTILSLHTGYVDLMDFKIINENAIMITNELRRNFLNRDWGKIYRKWEIESRKSKVKFKSILVFLMVP